MVNKPVFELNSGRLCLDFANTVEKRPTETPQDLLEGYADLLSWARQARVLSPEEERALSKRARARPGEAKKALDRARRIREVLFAVFSKRGQSSLKTLRRELPSAYLHPVLRQGLGYELDWEDDPRALDRMLGPILRSATELLTSKELDRVRVCGAENCAWLFVDESRNRSRQWCDMKVCGNRAKARRFYRRRQSLRQRGSRGGRRSAGKRGSP